MVRGVVEWVVLGGSEMAWASAPEVREQMVLFATSLDEVIPEDHLVRVLDEVLRTLDWSEFEARYHGSLGAKPIHPRVLASVLLYGLMTRVRSSRQLEAALWCRVDFRWLAEGWQIDHTTLSNFRKNFGELLKGIHTQFGVLAFQMGVTTLTQFGFDGTRLRSSNKRTRTVDVAGLEALEQELQRTFAEWEQEATTADARDEESFDGPLQRTPKDLAKAKNRLEALARARAEIERVKAAREPVPKRIPLTDPQSRLSPNKEGGFAPNYTPLALVDMESGLTLSDDVLQNTDEEQHLVAALEDIEARLAQAGVPAHVTSLAADGKFVTGPNLEALAQRDTAFYGPITPQPECVKRPAGSTPIATDHWEELPTTVVRKKTKTQPEQRQLAKEAFLYDKAQNCYWCPTGQQLPYTGLSTETIPGTERLVKRQRYRSEASVCAACPLRAKCLQATATERTLSRDQYEEHREALRERMTHDSSKARKSQRQAEGERPFAVIKHLFGIRQFLLRSLAKVRSEWKWMTAATNAQVMCRWFRTHHDRVPHSPHRPGGRASPAPVGP